MKLLTYLICILMCLLNSTPNPAQSDDEKKEYTIHIYTGDTRFKSYHEKKIIETVKSYIIQQLHQIPDRDIRVMEGTSSTDPFSLIILSWESEGETIVNILPIFVFKEVVKEIKIERRSEDKFLESISTDIMDEYVKFIEFCEAFKEKGKETAP